MADRASITRKAEGVAKTGAAGPMLAISRPMMDRVTNLQINADYITTLLDVTSNALRDFAEVLERTLPERGIAAALDWTTFHTLLDLTSTQADIIREVSRDAEHAAARAEKVA